MKGITTTWAAIWYHRKSLGVIGILTILALLLFTIGTSYAESFVRPETVQVQIIEDQTRIQELNDLVRSQQEQIHQAELRILEIQAANEILADNKIQEVQAFDMELTAYCACEICCDDWADGITYTGTVATQGRTIAVDPSIIPLGSTVWIPGLGLRIAEDIGGAIQENRIDVYFDDHQDALNFGRQTQTIFIIKTGGK